VIGIVGGVGTALLLRHSFLAARIRLHPRVARVPMPNVQTVAMKLLDRVYF
jgi:hypothetical protein